MHEKKGTPVVNHQILAMNMSGIYTGLETALRLTEPVLDCTDLTGTDCYCDDTAFAALLQRTGRHGPEGIHLIDTGNYHYLTYLWLKKLPAETDMDLVVFDNHPDAKDPAFGDLLSCGGWVKRACTDLKNLKRVLLLGTDPELLCEELPGIEQDTETRQEGRLHTAFQPEKPQEHERLLDHGNLRNPEKHRSISNDFEPVCFENSSVQVYADRTYTPAGRRQALEAFLQEQTRPIYLSVDIDCLAPACALTGWNQGNMSLAELEALVRALVATGRLSGADICGGAPADMPDREGLNLTAYKHLISVLEELPG